VSQYVTLLSAEIWMFSISIDSLKRDVRLSVHCMIRFPA